MIKGKVFKCVVLEWAGHQWVIPWRADQIGPVGYVPYLDRTSPGLPGGQTKSVDLTLDRYAGALPMAILARTKALRGLSSKSLPGSLSTMT